MRRATYLAIVLMLTIAVLPAGVLAANGTPESAIQLTLDNASHSDRLVGDTGGAVRFYRVDYAGNGQPVDFVVTARPGKNATGEGFGFKIYGPGGLVGQAGVNHNEDSFTRYTMALVSIAPGAYLVQVYNYTDHVGVDFDIQASGLAAATVPPGSLEKVGANTTPEGAVAIGQSSITVGGALAGSGSFQYFTVGYPGGSGMTIDLRYTPPSPFANNAVGFNLYSADGTLVAQGVEAQRDGTSVTVSFTLVQEAGEVFLLQVFDYESNFSASYTLSITGAAGSVADAKDNDTSDRAMPLSAESAAARGTIAPRSGEGTFNFYLLSYPGGNKAVTIRVSVDEDSGFGDRNVGFSLYKGADLVTTASSSLNDTGKKRVAFFTINEAEAATYGIQVFNWSGTSAMRYLIVVTGL